MIPFGVVLLAEGVSLLDYPCGQQSINKQHILSSHIQQKKNQLREHMLICLAQNLAKFGEVKRDLHGHDHLLVNVVQFLL